MASADINICIQKYPTPTDMEARLVVVFEAHFKGYNWETNKQKPLWRLYMKSGLGEILIPVN